MLLGELLIQRGAIDSSGLDAALSRQALVPSDRLGAVMVRLGLISEQTLLEALSEQLSVSVLRDPDIAACLPAITEWHAQNGVSQALAARLSFFAYRETEDGPLMVGTRDVLDSSLIEYLESGPCRGAEFRLSLVAARDLERVFAQIYRPRSVGDDHEDLRKLAEDAPVVELVNGVMARATDTRASDVHIEPEEFGFFVRYRIDGRLQAAEQYPRERFDAVVSRIKLISGLDIAERRLPQDGRFSIRTSGVDTDVRVSVIPGVLGESLVLRLLPNTQSTRFDLDNIGIEPDHLAIYRGWMAQPDGIVLVTGPTGSGKSTTLYATLVACDTEHERVLTVEDPVEYHIPGVTQFQVHPDIGFTFPAALRSILRHDPDTIMIGEIRDVETAGIAVQASLTGHRVFSTLHTNDTATAFLRLADMGVESFLVGATVRGVVAQRLVRRLCNDCAKAVTNLSMIPDEVLRTAEKLGADISSSSFREPVGCEACSHTGYKGRIAIYELMSANDELRAALSHASPSLGRLMETVGPEFRTLREDGILKALRGVTSIEEVLAIAGSTGQYQ
jgi:general secretion pathway protein E